MGELNKIYKILFKGKLSYFVYAFLGMVAAYFFYIFLGLILNTKFPVVVVVSGSMDHGINEAGAPCVQTPNYEESFENWWKNCGIYYASFNITKEDFLKFPFKDGFKKGDLPILMGSNDYKVGDIIVYSVPGQPYPIIHRIVKINEDGTFQTRGDHNSFQYEYEKRIKREQIHGKVIFIFPKLGYIKLLTVELIGGLNEIL